MAYDGSEEARRALEWAPRIDRESHVAVISIAPTLEASPKIKDAVDPTSDVDTHRRQLDDAVTILAMAINKAGKTDPDAIREAILSVKKFPGAEGEYNFDANGDGLHGYNIVRNEKGEIVFEKHVDFND